jgi:hypothetical protein
MPRPTLASMIASSLRAADIQASAEQTEGWLIPYAERVARRCEVKALTMRHLAPAARLFERAYAGEKVRGLISIPVRHGKTSLAKAAILGGLRRNPRIRINYASYASDLAEAKTYEVRQLAPGEGIRLDPNFQTDPEWRTEQGGAVKSGGLIGGPWNGQGANLAILDDPYKNAEQAMSRAFREKTRSAFDGAWKTRLEPGGGMIVISARWHTSDLVGELEREGWEIVNLPALDSEDEPLWQERWSLEELDEIRRTNPYWWSLYMGQPRPEGGCIFDPAHLGFYDRLPETEWTEAAGVDLAYGQKARNDRTSHTFFRRYSATPRKLYLVEPWVGHEEETLYACRLAAAQVRRGGGPSLTLPRTPAEVETMWREQLARDDVRHARRPPTRWGTSSTEQGTARLMRGYGAHVTPERAAVDLLARCQASGYVAAWQEGRILYPASGGPMVDAYRLEHEDFTGSPSDRDDTIASSNSAYELLHVAPASLGGGKARGLGSWGFSSREG